MRATTAGLASLLVLTLGLGEPLAQPQHRPIEHPSGGYAQPGAPNGTMRPRPLTRYSRYRTSWYIGFGLGGGGGKITTNSSATMDPKGGIMVNFRVGGVITPHFLVGFEASAWRYQDNDKDIALQFNHYDAMATFFPIYDSGLFIKGGLGLGLAIFEFGGLSMRTEAGLDLKGGLGYEFQISQAFNLGIEGSYGLTKYDGGATHDFGLFLNVLWY